MADGSQQYHGNYGRVWLDSDLLFDISAVTASIELQREDVKFAGEEYTDSKVVGKIGTGSFTIKQFNSRVVDKFIQAYKNGQDVRFTLVILEDNRQVGGTPLRWAFKNCWLTGNIPVAGFEVGNISNKEFNFGFKGDPVKG